MKGKFNTEIMNEYVKANKLTKAEFCRQCEISVSTFYNIINGKNVYLKSLLKIAKRMNVKISCLVK